MSLRLCGHRKPDGLPCGSPALRGKRLCYFHLDPEKRRTKAVWIRVAIAFRVAKARERVQSGPF